MHFPDYAGNTKTYQDLTSITGPKLITLTKLRTGGSSESLLQDRQDSSICTAPPAHTRQDNNAKRSPDNRKRGKNIFTLFRGIKYKFLYWFCTALWVLMGPAHLIRAKTTPHLNKIPAPLLSSLPNVNLKQRERNHRGDYGPKCCFRD